MLTLIIGIGVGIIILGYLYHRYTKQTVDFIDKAANTVNSAIDKVKK